ncbi:UNVERIFIED_ORG: hypothetical protein ABIB63_004175 [Xanthomonas axonopodis]
MALQKGQRLREAGQFEVAAVGQIKSAGDSAPVVGHGVVNYPVRRLGLCAGVTDARYRTTTEVYPDSPRATPDQCNAAQVAAICAAIDYALAQH